MNPLPTRKLAIDAKCRDCIYDPLNGGTWLQQVENCTCETSCALWPFRPVTRKLKEARQNERISQMNEEELQRFREKQENARIRMQKPKP